MQEQRKPSVGTALVDVFDAGVALVKAEINAFTEKLTALAKAKGIGVVLILAALAPLTLFAIFFILAIYFALVALGFTWWGAATIIAVVSLLMAVAMIAFGVSKLGEKLEDDQAALTEDERLEAEYLAEKRRQRQQGDAVSGAVVATGIPAYAYAETSGRGGQRYEEMDVPLGRIDAEATPTVRVVDGSDMDGLRAETVSGYTSAQRGRAASAARRFERRPAVAGDVGAAMSKSKDRDDYGAVSGYERPTADSYGVPVYEASADGTPEMYGQHLNEKLGGHDDHGHNHDHHDPDVIHPEPLAGAPEIDISTRPTYREDMERGNK